MIYQKYLFSIILFCGSLYSQINTNLLRMIEIPVNIMDSEFQPSKISANTTGFYLLDDKSRQIVYLSNEGDVVFAGGYGVDNDAFIDPIDILSWKLRTWIVDRSENKLIEFDQKLNFIRTIEFESIYPDYSEIDDWGNLLLLSEQEYKILKINPLTEGIEELIDLSILKNASNCFVDMHVADNGAIGILSNCDNSVILFNRLGKLENKFQIENIDAKFLIKLSENWFAINTVGQIISIPHNEKVYIPVEQTIIDVAQMDGVLYVLFSDKIWVVDVTME